MQQKRREKASQLMEESKEREKELKEKQQYKLQMLENLLKQAKQEGYEEVREEALRFDCFTVQDLKKRIRKLQIKLGIITKE